MKQIVLWNGIWTKVWNKSFYETRLTKRKYRTNRFYETGLTRCKTNLRLKKANSISLNMPRTSWTLRSFQHPTNTWSSAKPNKPYESDLVTLARLPTGSPIGLLGQVWSNYRMTIVLSYWHTFPSFGSQLSSEVAWAQAVSSSSPFHALASKKKTIFFPM